MSTQVICLSSSPVGPSTGSPSAPQPLGLDEPRPQFPARMLDFDSDSEFDDNLDNSFSFGNAMDKGKNKVIPPTHAKRTNHSDAFFHRDDFDSTGDLSLYVEDNRPPKKRRLEPPYRLAAKNAATSQSTSQGIPDHSGCGKSSPGTYPIDISSSGPSSPKTKRAPLDPSSKAKEAEKNHIPSILLSDEEDRGFGVTCAPFQSLGLSRLAKNQKAAAQDRILSPLPEAIISHSSPAIRHGISATNTKPGNRSRPSTIIGVNDSSDDLPDLTNVEGTRRYHAKHPPCHSSLKTGFSRPGSSTNSTSNSKSRSEQRPPSSSTTTFNQANLSELKVPLQEKERERQSRAAGHKADKARRQAEREKAKEERKRDRERAAALAAVNKVRIDRKETVKQMIVRLPASMPEALRLQTQALLEDIGAKHEAWLSPVPGVVRWKRKVEARWDEEARQFVPVMPERVEDEAQILVIVTAEEFVRIIAQDGVGVHARDLMEMFPETEVLLYLIERLEPWRRSMRNKRNRKFAVQVHERLAAGSGSCSSASALQEKTSERRQKRKEEGDKRTELENIIDDDVLEDALLELQLTHPCIKVHHTNCSVETAHWITTFTSHISTVLWKQAEMCSRADAGFCMDSNQIRTGEDARDAFVRMLEQVSRVTAPIAHGVVREFGDVATLVRELEKGGPDTLAEVRRAMGRDGEIGDRALGGAVSRRLWKVLTCRDEMSEDV